MPVVIRTGIENGKPFVAEQESIGPCESIGTRIGRSDARHATPELHRPTALRIELLVKDQGRDHCTQKIGGLRKW